MVKIMPDKIASAVSYCVSGALVCGGSVSQWIHDLDWNQIAVVIGIVLGIATFFTNFYFQRRQTRAIEKAAGEGKAVIRGE
ncbi:phage holin [Candidatus Pantoea multigeneris]|uniref:Lysis protein n=1 Tax=Candidatus Pantoea multigeneris TaxID=2608357 RepID=A0ABX0R815_9GAMM|nr:phage holin [Pantoea multigeneris]NIF20593.1 lysis protein [Pantoea multigeneris]